MNAEDIAVEGLVLRLLKVFCSFCDAPLAIGVVS